MIPVWTDVRVPLDPGIEALVADEVAAVIQTDRVAAFWAIIVEFAANIRLAADVTVILDCYVAARVGVALGAPED